MKKVLAIISITLVAFGAWRALRGSANDDGGKGQELFYGRAWLDHVPTSKTDTFNVFGTSKANPFGWFAERTVWKGAWERFQYKPGGDGQIEVVLPHSGKKLRMAYRAWKCSEKKFDYCLELSGEGGPKKYYSKRGWERRGFDDAALDEELAAGLAP